MAVDMRSGNTPTPAPWGQQLRYWRTEVRQWSRQEMADQIIRLAYEIKEERGVKLDARLIAKWESGAVKSPQAIYRRLLNQLGAPTSTDAGPSTISATSAASRETRTSLSSELHPDSGDAFDNTLTATEQTSITDMGTPATEGRISTAIGKSDTQTLVDASQHYEQMYRQVGGIPTQLRLRDFLDTHALPLIAGRYNESAGRDLHRAVAGLTALAGICAYDCEQHSAAQRHFGQALRFAASAGDLRFDGYVLALMVNQQLALGDFRQAIKYIEIAIGSTAGYISPALMADLHAMQANAYAQLGEPRPAYAAIAHAEASAARIRYGEEPAETSYIRPGMIEAKIGEALVSIGDLAPARRYAQESLGSEDHARGRVNRLASMASLELRSGDIESASSSATQMVISSRGMESRRLHTRFRKLRIELNGISTTVTAEAIEQIDRSLQLAP